MVKFACLLIWFLPLQGGEQDEAARLKEKIDHLSKRIVRLESELGALKDLNQKLKVRLAQGDQDIMDMAREAFALRQRMKANGGPKPEEKDDKKEEIVKPDEKEIPKPLPKPEVFGPDHDIAGKVMAISRSAKNFILDVGEKDGVKEGYRFEIRSQARDGNPIVAVGKVRKLIGSKKEIARLTVVEGDIHLIEVGDKAKAIRAVTGSIPEKDTPKTEFNITGKAGGQIVIDFGKKHGAAQTQIVYVFRQGKMIGRLRLDDVKVDYSIASVVEQEIPFKSGDKVSHSQPKNTFTGRILGIAGDTITISLGTNHGAQGGQILVVRRGDKILGKIEIVKIEKNLSWARAYGESKLSDFAEKDVVEREN